MIVNHSFVFVFFIINDSVILRQDREQDTDTLEMKCILTKLHLIDKVINCAVEEKILSFKDQSMEVKVCTSLY